ILQLPKLVTAHAAILLAPPVERQFGNADLANGIRHRHALAAQNLNLPKLRDDLVGLVSLLCHCGPPSWSKPYFKVDPFNGGGSDHASPSSAGPAAKARPAFFQKGLQALARLITEARGVDAP